MAAPTRPFPLLRLIALLALAAALVMRASHTPAPVNATAADSVFSAERAMRHVKAVAQRPHPIGSQDAARVRAYVMAELAALHVPVEVQEATGVGTRYQVAGRVHNVIARLPGTKPGGRAILLMAHTDGVPAGPAASDDGSGTAVLLESLRALRAGPPLEHDVIALFTDGEEAGLLGAAAFVREHRWANDVGATLNFDARGTTGRVFMFETGSGNLDLVRIYRGAPDVNGTSLMVTVYRTLPNDTDLSELAILGRPALNFAFADGVDRYHTSQDNVAQLNSGTIQHEGEQALAITRALANGPLPRPTTGDAVFFDFPVLGLVLYPEGAAVPLAVFGAIVVAITLIAIRRRERRWIRDLILGVLASIIAPALGGGAAYLAALAMTRIHSTLGGTPALSGMYAIAITLLALTLTAACWALARKWGSGPGTHAGALIVWTFLTLFVSWKAPGASFFLLWPLLAASVAALLEPRQEPIAAASLGLATLIAMALLVPIIHSIGVILLGLTGGGGVVMGVLIPLLALLIAPQFEAIVGQRRWRATLYVLASTVLFFVVGAITVRNSIRHPVPSILVYAADAEGNDAWLVTPASLEKRGSWTAAALGTSPQLMTPGQHLAAGSPPSWLTNVFGQEMRVAVRAAPRIPLHGPVATAISDSTTDRGRSLTLRIVPAPGTLNVDMRSVDGTVLAAAVDGRIIDTTRYRHKTARWTLSYAAPPDAGFTLALTLPRGARITLEISAQSAGIGSLTDLSIAHRPDDVVPVQTGDQADIYRKVTF
ncbi:MAG: M28 family peptidase [Gemmatimonadota bacterium]|nr:M28 family peptidase [Gemmatimonadota bacterium]